MRSLLLLPAIVLPALAQAQSTISASVGTANSAECTDSFSIGGPNTILSCEREKPSRILRIAHVWKSGFGLELAYFHLGSANADTSYLAYESLYNIVYGPNSYAYTHDRLKASVQAISLVRTFAVSESARADIKLGLGRAKSELRACSVLRVSVAEDLCAQAKARPRDGLYLGVSFSYRLSSMVSAVASIDYVPLAQAQDVYWGTFGGSGRRGTVIPSIGAQLEF